MNAHNWAYVIMKLMVWLSLYTCVVSDIVKGARALGQKVSICFALFCIAFLVISHSIKELKTIDAMMAVSQPSLHWHIV